MNEETFGEKFRRLRDGKLTPQDSWKFRHGHTFMGHTFHVHVINPLNRFNIDDLKWILLQAVSQSEPTDIQIHFKKPIDNPELNEVDINNNFTEVINNISRFGFMPVTITTKFNPTGTGWIRMHLFSEEDLPGTPEFEQSSNTLLS